MGAGCGSRPWARQRLIMSRSHGGEEALQDGHAGGDPEGPDGGEAEYGQVLEDHAGTHGGPRRRTAPCGGGFTKGNTTDVHTLHIILHHFLKQNKTKKRCGKQLHVGQDKKLFKWW